MRSRMIVTLMALVVVLAFSSVALAQAPGGARDPRNAGQAQTDHVALPSIPGPPGWGNCPRCQNNDDRAKAWKDNKVDGHAFNAKDLSGVWGWGLGNTTDDAFDPKAIPPLTDLGKKMQAATMADPGKQAH